MEEQDSFETDKSQVAIACKNLQVGRNKLIVPISESNPDFISTGASVIQDPIGTSFRFGSGNANTAQYTFTFNVKKNCYLPSN